jgi:hypothetical protein
VIRFGFVKKSSMIFFPNSQAHGSFRAEANAYRIPWAKGGSAIDLRQVPRLVDPSWIMLSEFIVR